jgi:hypothetical protein
VRVDDAEAPDSLAHISRHVICCHLPREPSVQSASGKVASDIRQAIVAGKGKPEGGDGGVDISPAVILATGGFANDHGEDSLLNQHAPAAVRFATTNTRGTTGMAWPLPPPPPPPAQSVCQHTQLSAVRIVQPVSRL